MAGGQGGQLPTQILEDQKAPLGSGGAPHYYLPTQISEATYASVLSNYVFLGTKAWELSYYSVQSSL